MSTWSVPTANPMWDGTNRESNKCRTPPEASVKDTSHEAVHQNFSDSPHKPLKRFVPGDGPSNDPNRG